MHPSEDEKTISSVTLERDAKEIIAPYPPTHSDLDLPICYCYLQGTIVCTRGYREHYPPAHSVLLLLHADSER